MKSLAEIFASQGLRPYLDKVSKLIKLNTAWCLAIPEWADHCKIANLEDELLVLQVENAALATRLRYAIPEILKTIAHCPEFTSVKKIKAKISQPTTKKR